jgi:hypothetical protein
MLDALDFWACASHLPFLFPGSALHRAALQAAFGRRFDLAERLFEAAVLRYRARLSVPALARLRVHQMIARAQACMTSDPARALQLAHEIEARLMRLDDLEDLEPPFAMASMKDVRERFHGVLMLAETLGRAA